MSNYYADRPINHDDASALSAAASAYVNGDWMQAEDLFSLVLDPIA
jgi:hypothetical protein